MRKNNTNIPDVKAPCCAIHHGQTEYDRQASVKPFKNMKL